MNIIIYSSKKIFFFPPQGVDSLVPYISSHCVRVEQGDLSLLLKEANPLVTSLSPAAQEGLQTLGKWLSLSFDLQPHM